MVIIDNNLNAKSFKNFVETYYNLTKPSVELRADSLFINFRLSVLGLAQIKPILNSLLIHIRHHFGSHISIFFVQFRIGKFLFSKQQQNFRWFFPSTNSRIHDSEWLKFDLNHPLSIIKHLFLDSDNSKQHKYSEHMNITSETFFVSLSNLEVIVRRGDTLGFS